MTLFIQVLWEGQEKNPDKLGQGTARNCALVFYGVLYCPAVYSGTYKNADG